VSVPEGYEINVGKSRLTLDLRAASGSSSVNMQLTRLAITRESRSGGWFHPDVKVATYELALSPRGAEKLRELQSFVLSNDPKTFEFAVRAPLEKIPSGAREVKIWAALKLWSGKPYMPLIDGATLRFGQTQSGS
jgi:hypothetical protein